MSRAKDFLSFLRRPYAHDDPIGSQSRRKNQDGNCGVSLFHQELRQLACIPSSMPVARIYGVFSLISAPVFLPFLWSR